MQKNTIPSIQKTGLSGILYELYYIDVENPPVFDEKSAKYFDKKYSKEQLKMIGQGIEWALEHPDYPFDTILPQLPAKQEQILRFLKYVYSGFLRSGLYEPASGEGDQ